MKTQIRVEAREILFVFIMTLLIALTPLKAYGQQQDGDKLVYVPQRYVSAEGLTHVTAPTTSVTNVLGWGGARNVVLGIPMLIAGIFIWMWALRRFFLGYRVVVKRTGFFTKEYARQEPYKFESDDWRAACGSFMFAAIITWVAVMTGCVIF